MAKIGPFRVPRDINNVWPIIRALGEGLLDLTFADNFRSFEIDVDIPAGTEVGVINHFRDGRIPTRYLIVSQEGNGLVTKGATAWSADMLYLHNHGASDVSVTVIFLR